MKTVLVRSRIAWGASALALLALAGPAFAQEGPSGAADDASVPDVVVTGSRIARPAFETVQPTQVVGAAQIDDRGYTNVAQALGEIPAFGPPGNSAAGTQSPFGAGQTFVDFFGLGSQRTLVLVDGRRFVSSNTATIFGPVSPGTQVDLNNIPTSLIERVETVTVGGAPIYGSDAIAGTVNVILKHDYQGLELKLQSGVSQRGDAPDTQVALLAGRNFADGRGNITFSGEYDRAAGLTAGDRDVTERGYFFGTPPASANSPYGQVVYPAQRFTAFTAGGVPFSTDDYLAPRSGIRNAAGQLLQFGPNGTLVPLDLGNVMRQGFISSGGNGFDMPAQANLLTDSERYIGSVRASYQIADNIRFFGEGWYSHSRATNLIDEPNYNTALFGPAGTPDGNIAIRLDNPYLSAADRATIAANLPAGQEEFYLGRALSDLTTGRAVTTVETWRVVGGFDGTVGLLGRDFKWEASAVYGRSQADSRIDKLVEQNFLNALDAVDDGNGNIICRPGAVNAPIQTISLTCAPLNILGSGQASKAARDYVMAVATPRSVNEQIVFNANIKGPAFALFGNDVKMVAGYEHREERTRFDPGAYFYGDPQPDGSRTPYGRSIPVDPVAGRYHTNEVFGEIVAPFVTARNGLRWLHTLEFDGSARYVRNSLSGGDLTWSAGGRIGFVPDVTFRGNFTRSIRSPAITEAFNPSSTAYDAGADPCDARFAGNGPNPAVRKANCAAAGIDTATFSSNFSSFGLPVTVAGNPDLRNEKANSWTLGAIVQPSFAPGLSLAVDWVSISLKDAIVTLDGASILNACYDSPGYPNAFCKLFDRDASGQITAIREGYYNAASYKSAGLQATLSYRLPLERIGAADAGALGFAVNYFYRDKLETRVGTDDINHIAGEIGYPRHSGTANLSYEGRALDVLVQAQYVGKGRFDMDAAPDATDVAGVGDWWLFNATVGVKVNERFGLKLIVDNLFDVTPPWPAPINSGTGTFGSSTRAYFSGIMGRYFRAAATVKF